MLVAVVKKKVLEREGNMQSQHWGAGVGGGGRDNECEGENPGHSRDGGLRWEAWGRGGL